MNSQPEPFYQNILDKTLEELEGGHRLKGERLSHCQTLVDEFIKIAADMPDAPSLSFKAQNTPPISEEGPESWKKTFLLELFAIGLLKALYIVEELAVSEKAYRYLLSTIAMDIYQESQQLVAGLELTEQQLNCLPTEEQKASIQQKTLQHLMPYVATELTQASDKANIEQEPLKHTRDKESQLEKFKIDKLVDLYTTLSLPITSVLKWIDDAKLTANNSDSNSQNINELELHHPAWFGLAWAGPCLLWSIFHLEVTQLLPYLPILPVAIIISLWLRPLIKQGLFHCSAESLVIVTLVNSLILISNRFEIWFIGLVHLGILAGFALGFGIKQKVITERSSVEKVKADLSEFISPDQLYCKLGVDLFALHLGSNLAPIADPDQDGELLGKISKLRQNLTKDLGYIMPSIRVMDNRQLALNDYQILVRGQIVGKGSIHPGRYMVLESHVKSSNITLSEDALKDNISTHEPENVYWLLSSDIPKALQEHAISAVDVLIEHLQGIVIRHIDMLISHIDAAKYLAVISVSYTDLAENLVPKRLEIATLRQILVNLIREKVSIRDILLVFERLLDYLVLTNNLQIDHVGLLNSNRPDMLSEHLRQILGRQICSQFANEQNQIYAIEISDTWTKLLRKHLSQNVFGIYLDLTAKDKMNFTESVKAAISKTQATTTQIPIIVCTSDIRLAVFRLLEINISNIAVIAYEEIMPDIMIIALETI